MQTPFAVSGLVGANRRVTPKDTLAVKRALQRLDLYEPPEWGVTETADIAMIDGLKSFQSENGLSVDGVMKPGGPTERLLKTALWETENGVSTKTPQLRLAANVGEKAPNRPEDVRTVKRALAAAGYKSGSGVSGDIADREFLGNNRLFKSDFNLGDGNRIKSNDTANAVLARISRPSQATGSDAVVGRNARRPQLAQAGTGKRDAAFFQRGRKRAAERKASILNNRPIRKQNLTGRSGTILRNRR